MRILLIMLFTLSSIAYAQDHISVDMNADWLRRDWDKCQENVKTHYQNGIFTIQSDHAAALFWQVPTQNGTPLPIDRDQSWIERCDRPPTGFEKDIRKQANNQQPLISVSEYPHISWRWRISNTIDDSQTADKKGNIQQEGDDFAAKIGISILNTKGELHEIAYLWTRTIPEESQLTQVTTIIPWVLKFKWYRIVAESGDQYVNTWVNETRHLYNDFKRFYPNEEPAEIVRIYLMSDSDNTNSRVTGSFADLSFHKNSPLARAKGSQ